MQGRSTPGAAVGTEIRRSVSPSISFYQERSEGRSTRGSAPHLLSGTRVEGGGAPRPVRSCTGRRRLLRRPAPRPPQLLRLMKDTEGSAPPPSTRRPAPSTLRCSASAARAGPRRPAPTRAGPRRSWGPPPDPTSGARARAARGAPLLRTAAHRIATMPANRSQFASSFESKTSPRSWAAGRPGRCHGHGAGASPAARPVAVAAITDPTSGVMSHGPAVRAASNLNHVAVSEPEPRCRGGPLDGAHGPGLGRRGSVLI